MGGELEEGREQRELLSVQGGSEVPRWVPRGTALGSSTTRTPRVLWPRLLKPRPRFLLGGLGHGEVEGAGLCGEGLGSQRASEKELRRCCEPMETEDSRPVAVRVKVRVTLAIISL